MKETLKQYFKDNLLFWAGLALIVLIMGLFLIENGQVNSHIMLNGCHTPFLDKFFYYVTYLGGGLPCYIGVAVMIFRFRKGLFILLAQGIATLFTQPLKHFIARPRPLTLFDGNFPVPVVDGYPIPGGFNTCPSGHTTAIFAFMACLAALLPKKYKNWQIAFLLLGVLGGYSRIYLSCHFLEDVLLGAPVGAISAAIAFMLLYYKQWGECPIYKLRIKRD